MIRVLIVEDSPVSREFLIHILSSDQGLEIAGTAATGEEALLAVAKTKPDVITMDIHMPGMNGYEATRRIMETHPTPIVIVTASYRASETAGTFRAIEAGALSIVTRPVGLGHPDYERASKELIQTVKLMSEVKVVRRYGARRADAARSIPASPNRPFVGLDSEIRLVVFGASTGGPLALQTILTLLPKDFASPVVIVQHMATGFVQGLADWLAETSGQRVKVAEPGEQLLSSTFYVAPDGFQLKIDLMGRVGLSLDESENGMRPSVSCLFRSAAESYASSAVGVLLTGMGVDGARELMLMREKGSVTIAQNESTSVVYGMPGEAIRIGAALKVLAPEEIAAFLAQLVVDTCRETNTWAKKS